MPIVEAWQKVETQWSAVPLPNGGVYWLGLDYAGVTAGLALAGVSIDAATWAGVRVMERAAAAALNGVRG